MAESLAELRETMRQDLFRHSLGSLYDYLELMELFLAGDVKYWQGTAPDTDPAELSAAAINAAIGADGEYLVTMRFKIIDDDSGDVLVKYSNATKHTVNVSKTSTSGVVARVGDAVRPVDKGWGECVVRLTGTWASGDTIVFACGSVFYGRYTIASKSYTATLVA